LKKRGRDQEKRGGVKLDYEYEYEREDGRKKESNVSSVGAKRRAVSKSTAGSGKSIDF
jgi:hypothetical protein